MILLRLCATPVRRLRGPVVGRRRGVPLDTVSDFLEAPNTSSTVNSMDREEPGCVSLSQHQGARFGLINSAMLLPE